MVSTRSVLAAVNARGLRVRPSKQTITARASQTLLVRQEEERQQ